MNKTLTYNSKCQKIEEAYKGVLLSEGKLKRGDVDLEEYYQDQAEEDKESSDSPYAVGWSGQTYSTYGKSYKPKGEGGELTNLNVATYREAKKLADKLDDDYKRDKFYETMVYAKKGEGGDSIEYYGAFVIPMKTLKKRDLDRYTSRKTKDHKGK